VPSFQPPPLPQLLPLCSPSITPLAGKLALAVEEAIAVAPYEARATLVGHAGGQLETLVSQFEKSTLVLTLSPLPGPTGPGPLAAPHQCPARWASRAVVLHTDGGVARDVVVMLNHAARCISAEQHAG